MQNIPRYDAKCTKKVTDKLLKETIRPKIDNLFDDIYTSKKIILHEQDNLVVGLDVYSSVWSLCNKDILMIDFDEKEGISKNKAIELIREYTNDLHEKGFDLLFYMFETDRGMHAFIVNQYIDYFSEEALHIMIDTCTDEMYIGYVEVKGFCVRLGPKVKLLPKEGETLQDIVDKEFIARPAVGKDFKIGYGKPIPEIEDILDFHLDMINWFTEQYRKNLNMLTKKRYIYETDSFDIAPPESFIHEVSEVINKKLQKYNILRNKSEFERRIRPKIRTDRRDYTLDVYSQDNIHLTYDIYFGIWSICTPNILMIDFDLEPRSTKLDFINTLRGFCTSLHRTEIDYLFWIYETDRGVHAFLVNKLVNYKSEEARFILQNLEPKNEEHIQFVYGHSHCTRISPKFLNNNYLMGNVSLKSLEFVKSEFISKKCLGQVCEVGFGVINNFIASVLAIEMNMTNYISNLYKQNFDEMVNKRYIATINDTFYAPTEEIVELLRDHFISLLNTYNMLDNDETGLSLKIQEKLVKSSRYSDLFNRNFQNKLNLSGGTVFQNAEESCGRRSISSPKKQRNNPYIKDIRLTDYIPLSGLFNYMDSTIIPTIESSCKLQNILLRGPQYPFVLGYDRNMNLLYIMFYDLLMIDWDVIEGMPKDSTEEVLNRFISWQKNIPENDRITFSEPCFKLYETDNGTHAFLVSHRMPYYTDKSSLTMLHTCSDFTYAAFSKSYGYSIRLSPKIKNKDGSLKSEDEVKNQFVQEPMNIYVGNKGHIDPYLEDLTKFIYDIQKYIMKQNNIAINLRSEDRDFLENIRSYVVTRYKKVRERFISGNNLDWARSVRSCTHQY